MQNTPTRDTPCELALRSAVHGLGLRYRVDIAPIPGVHRKADIVFRKAKIAVFVDGCYWHGCERHGSIPKVNTEWWLTKFETTRRRDVDTNLILRRHGWKVLRFWEHDDPGESARRIAIELRIRQGQ